MSGALETLLCRIHQRSHCHLVGNATAGLCLALNALGLRGKRVAVPNSVCPNVPLAVLLSGNVPIYIDVSMSDLGMDPDALVSRDDLDAVIAVHGYGSVCSIEAMSAYCRSKGIPLIEDLAVAQGACLNGRPVGSFGDISVVSFGFGKIIEVGHGGAILTGAHSLHADVMRRDDALPGHRESDEAAVSAFGRYHTELYNRHYGSGIAAFCDEFTARALALRDHILHRFDRAFETSIAERLNSLPESIRTRQARADILAGLFAPHESPALEVFQPAAGSVHWRFNIFIDNRDRLLKSLLAKRFKISSWFPSADLFFEGRPTLGAGVKTSDRIGDRILNLWVNDEVDGDYLQAVAREVLEHAATPGCRS